jgi:hypothetical protein
MYRLTLSSEHRREFSYVGESHRVGELYSLLYQFGRWDDSGDVTFTIPEDIACQIRSIADWHGWSWPAFTGDLAWTLNEFCKKLGPRGHISKFTPHPLAI